MDYLCVLEYAKMIAVILGIVVLVFFSISAICVIVVFSVVGLRKVIIDNSKLIDSRNLKGRLQALYARHADQVDWQNCIYQVEHIIDDMLLRR